MPINIASWNCCLGIQNKIDIVKIILQDYNLDFLFIQEAEIRSTSCIAQLQIQGYNLELSPTYGIKNSRSCCYIKNNIKYKRLNTNEKPNVEAIVIEIHETQIIGLSVDLFFYKVMHQKVNT